MAGYLLRRVAQAVIVVLGVTAVTFILEHLIPGSLARAILGTRASAAEVAAFNRANGLDHPLIEQYLVFLGRLARGDLGYSYRLNQSVDSLVLHQLPNDIVLVGTALMLALAIAIPLGIMQAVNRNRAVDHAATSAAFALYSMPSYWLAILLIAGLSIAVHALPPEAPQTASVGGLLADPRALVLPVLTLTLVNVALFSRYMRSSAIATLAEDYVRVARAKGLPTRLVLSRHVLRNSLISVTTLIGLSFPAVLTSGLVVEYVFNVPGVGLTYYTAAVNADYPVELGITVLVGIVTVLGNLLADVAYAVLDPRVRYD
ncbi:MAG TPA: ABC transporter permease [Streptosporangiaceae bacterium]|nr:ABC transporter permease [Streptosporangiaceae bacterium]